ncbi:sterol desaturase family protein [Ottowia sp.]|uniref:sterol desaturase family protein n=1 Tax=Ottowia sp. TaxID=1898956 RepID=UPI002CC1B1E9|nr:sterol desaturase family protein [Ottowia sp.]HNR82853.1 sterol desaturase family protein [Ottowia sp.]HNT84187.1 sterol desaturase family protein [Ottowia sp.]HQQ54283.1 sterol desaturase family protein [Ottowia sp.]
MTPADLFASAQQGLFETLIEPLAFALGLGNLLEDGFVAAGWLLIGVLQIGVLLAVIGPLQRLWPAEPVRDRAAIRVDVLYTLLHRLGLFKLAMFFSVEGWLTDAIGVLRARGLPTLHLDALWPGVTDRPLVSFVLYLLVFDFIGYWVHRAQHQWDWWWKLHAVHHSQRQMTMWSDDRNHLLDSVLTDAIMVVVAILIGVAPSQFVLLVACTQLLESLQHANLRWSFGRVGERLLVSPRFHRRHHAIGIGHEARAAREPGAAGPSQGASAPLGGSAPRAAGSVGAHVRGVNFGVLLPCWDALLGSADFSGRCEPTGIRDQVEQGRDYGRGFWAQQWRGLLRLAGRA